MKKNVMIAIFILMISLLNAQTAPGNRNSSVVYEKDLPVLYLSKDISLHFRSPEPVQFVDLSSNLLAGDLPAENVLRVKATEIQNPQPSDSTSIASVVRPSLVDWENLGIVTIVGQSFMAQYKIVYREITNGEIPIASNIEIRPEVMKPLEYPEFTLSKTELRKYALRINGLPDKKPERSISGLKMKIALNGVYVVDDYIFLDLTFSNTGNLTYDIDQLNFSIDDKKIYKSTNVQAIAIEPVYQLYENKTFKRKFRNIYVFKKFTFPNNKVLNLRLVEDPISGRTLQMGIKYKYILEADTF